MAYEWKENICCRSIYKVLESDDLLDEFEASDVPFDEASKLEMGDLRYWAHLGSKDVRDATSWGMTRRFINYLAKETKIDRQNPEIKTEHVYDSVYQIFRKKSSTILELAEKVDELCRFDDEQAISERRE